MSAKKVLIGSGVVSLCLSIILFAGKDIASGMSPTPPAASRCVADNFCIDCSYSTKTLFYWWGLVPVWRQVHYQVPLGTPPSGGWPVVVMYQGSLFSGEMCFSASKLLPFGAYYQTEVVKKLLDNGYAVICPEAHLDGKTFWDTNIPPYAMSETLWRTSSDHHFVEAIFDNIAGGKFGRLNINRMYATGISSGGYMTSRMAVSYRGRFRALAIQSASYATCTNLISFDTVVCNPPDYIPGHPPTLFLHGGLDLIVPICTMEWYEENLRDQGVETRMFIKDTASHEWFEGADDEIFTWFNSHR